MVLLQVNGSEQSAARSKLCQHNWRLGCRQNPTHPHQSRCMQSTPIFVFVPSQMIVVSFTLEGNFTSILHS